MRFAASVVGVVLLSSLASAQGRDYPPPPKDRHELIEYATHLRDRHGVYAADLYVAAYEHLLEPPPPSLAHLKALDAAVFLIANTSDQRKTIAAQFRAYAETLAESDDQSSVVAAQWLKFWAAGLTASPTQ